MQTPSPHAAAFHFGHIPWVTLGLIILNIGTFVLWQHASPSDPDLLIWQGAKNQALVLELGQWWRLLSCHFLHVSVWHLLANCLFLFNLGGPAEAIFRRSHFIFLVWMSAIGSSALSLLGNPRTSCGASGIVFGIWGAVAIFGIRHRVHLSQKYHRYFFRWVIPYAIFALYVGFVDSGTDNWAHVGGLLSGACLGAVLPPKLERHTALHTPVVGAIMAFSAFSLALLCERPRLTMPLTLPSTIQAPACILPIPATWSTSVAIDTDNMPTFAFDNGAGVGIGISTHFLPHATSSAAAMLEFSEEDLPQALSEFEADNYAATPPKDLLIAGQPAQQLDVDITTETRRLHATYIILVTGTRRCAVSFTAPAWLYGSYAKVFEAIIQQLR